MATTATATVSILSNVMGSDGQLALPPEILDQLGLKPGDKVEFVVKDGQTVLRPASEPMSSFAKYVGAVPVFANIEEVNAWVRDMRDDEEGGLTKW